MVLLVIIFKRATKLCEVVRYYIKSFILKLVDAVYSISKINCGLFYCFPLASLITSSLVELNLIRNVFNIVVELAITSVFIVSTRFLNLRTMRGRTRGSCLGINGQ